MMGVAAAYHSSRELANNWRGYSHRSQRGRCNHQARSERDSNDSGQRRSLPYSACL